jgi:hypothetical protein
MQRKHEETLARVWSQILIGFELHGWNFNDTWYLIRVLMIVDKSFRYRAVISSQLSSTLAFQLSSTLVQTPLVLLLVIHVILRKSWHNKEIQDKIYTVLEIWGISGNLPKMQSITTSFFKSTSENVKNAGSWFWGNIIKSENPRGNLD